jgi:glutaredoxin 3
MTKVEIYTTRYCPYCHAAKRLLSRKGVEFTEIDVSGDPKGRSDMVARANGRMTVPQIFIGSTHVGGSDDLPCARARRQARRPARPRRRARGRRARTGIMSTGKAATFTAGLVQMRSGLSPQANLDAA